eukprot:10966318-Alexandrium_andersonii.AAC.1
MVPYAGHAMEIKPLNRNVQKAPKLNRFFGPVRRACNNPAFCSQVFRERAAAKDSLMFGGRASAAHRAHPGSLAA